MKDELVMNKNTGEVIPATEAIHIFYTVEKHKILESWLDDYELTGIDADNEITTPDFIQSINY